VTTATVGSRNSFGVAGKRNGLQLKVATKKVDPSAFFLPSAAGGPSREANRNDPRALILQAPHGPRPPRFGVNFATLPELLQKS
jgi:hypothetical protein